MPAPKSTQATPTIKGLNNTFGQNPDTLRSTLSLDDQTLEDLLANLGPEDQWTSNPEDPGDIQKLVNDAKSALSSSVASQLEVSTIEAEDDTPEKVEKQDNNYLTRDLDKLVYALDDVDEEKHRSRDSRLEDESRQAQDIVSKLLDEINLEKQNESREAEEISDSPKEEEGELFLPSAPSKLPHPFNTQTESSKKSLDFEADIAARMAALRGLGAANELGLPSAPTFKPVDKPVKGIMKKYTDEEIDSWCLICQDDATVKCLGCDGDLYCARCWKEGHMGPDVGWEERRHKWTNFKKPN